MGRYIPMNSMGFMEHKIDWRNEKRYSAMKIYDTWSFRTLYWQTDTRLIIVCYHICVKKEN